MFVEKVRNDWPKPSISGKGQPRGSNTLTVDLTSLCQNLDSVYRQRPTGRPDVNHTDNCLRVWLHLRQIEDTWLDGSPGSSYLDRDQFHRWSHRNLSPEQWSTIFTHTKGDLVTLPRIVKWPVQGPVLPVRCIVPTLLDFGSVSRWSPRCRLLLQTFGLRSPYLSIRRRTHPSVLMRIKIDSLGPRNRVPTKS